MMFNMRCVILCKGIGDLKSPILKPFIAIQKQDFPIFLKFHLLICIEKSETHTHKVLSSLTTQTRLNYHGF